MSKAEPCTCTTPIAADGERLGTVHLVYSLGDLFADLARSVGIGILALVVSVAVAVVFVSRVQRSFAEPIARLVAVAHAVSRYTVRVEPTETRDELGALIDTFNEMLVQKVRDGEVEAGRERFRHLNEALEARVRRAHGRTGSGQQGIGSLHLLRLPRSSGAAAAHRWVRQPARGAARGTVVE